jgi:hypothetical protein
VNDDREARPLPWWADRGVRLIVLCACLGGALLALLASRTSLPGALGIDGNGSAAAAATWCAPRGLSEVAEVDSGRLSELRAGVSEAAPRSGRRYAAGVALPEDFWSDDEPRTLRATRSAGGRWPAGYELRWWTPDYDAVADVLVFTRARQARRFYELAASSRCHRGGAPRTPTLPPDARGLAWTNPDGAQQEDVFLLRGRRVYRVAAVRLARTAPVSRRADFEFVEAMACALPDADCALSGLMA